MKHELACISIVLSLFFTSSAWSAMYKCTNTNGGVAYQEKPCEDENSDSTEIQLKTNIPKKPARITSENKKLFSYFTSYENLKVTVQECANKKSAYAEEITQAHQRYYDIAKDNIEAGREIFKRGFKGLPSSELRSIQQQAKADKKIEFQSMNIEKLNNLCDSQASKLRSLSGRVKNRSSGYQEGDLDPEGND